LGNEPTACGSMGTCSTCGPPTGFACLDGGTCGCRTQNDCDAGNACTAGQCSPNCGSVASSPCNGTCCDPMGNMCQPGGSSTTCGVSGGTCQTCPMNGSFCFNDGGCGCRSNNDCQDGYACNGGACTTSCGTTNPCKGGCCDFGTSTCQDGGANDDCAIFGTFCTNCTAGCMYGPVCLSGAGGMYCGCSASSDCMNDTHCSNTFQQNCDTVTMGPTAGNKYCGM
jgi:hypothetical protein